MDKRRCSKYDTFESSKQTKLSEKRGRSNIHEDLINLSSQVQMMSESFAACPIFSKHRSLRKDNSFLNRRKWLTKDVMLFYPNQGKNDVVVNYMIKDKDFLHLRKSKTFISREEILMRGYSEESLYSGSLTSREVSSNGSKIGMYDYRKVDSGKLIDLLQRELKALAALNPSVTLIVLTLTENLFHCQECRRCLEKISTSLPWILNRVQKLIKYVTTQRKETYLWPDDSSYLRVNFSKSSLGSVSKSKITLVPFASPKLLGKLEKIDPVALSEDNPGVQLLLEVKPELKKKKFFYPVRTEIQSSEYHATYTTVHLKENVSVPVVHVLTPAPKPRIIWEEKQEVECFRQFGVAVRAFYVLNPRIPASVTVAVGKFRLIRKSAIRKESKNLLKVLIEEGEWNVGQLPYSIFREKTNDKETFLENFRASYSKLVRDLMLEAEQEKMEAQKVNELEEEVKELKDLMLEVHKNQTELGKLLLEKKVFSQLMVRLTDPKMLEEESKALKKASKPSTSSSTIALQMKVDSLKRKCSLKNRLIMTLLKGLRSNIPKELWEEVVTYAFEDSESMDDFDSEKINEFIRQTSLLLTNEEKDRKLAPSMSAELQSAEGLSRDSDFSRSETTVPSDTDFESDYVTGVEDIPNEKIEVKKPRLRRKPFNGLNNPCQTSSFIQNILSEDSKTGVAVVDLFVAVKTVKDNLDYLARKNDDVLHQINALNVESGFVRDEYRNLAEDMRSMLNELNDETVNERLLKNLKRGKISCPKCSKDSTGCLDSIASTLKDSIKDRQISETLLGSFLASVLWLKKQEKKDKKEESNESTVQMISDMCEMLEKFADSTLENEDASSEREEMSPKKGSKEESHESDSAFEETFATPPPSPPGVFELKPKPSVTCMGDLTKENKKKSVSTGTESVPESVAVTLTEDIKSTVKYLKSKKKASSRMIKSDEKKLPKAVEFTIAASTTSNTFDVTVKTHEELQSYSSDSMDNLVYFDSDDRDTSSLSDEDEMEEFAQTNTAISKSESAIVRAKDVPTMTTYKTPKPAFFEVWKRCPKLFLQEVISTTARVKNGENWEVKEYERQSEQVVALVPGEKREEVVIEDSNLDLVIYIELEVEDNKKEQLIVDFKTNSLGTQTSNHRNEPLTQEKEEQCEKSIRDIQGDRELDETIKPEESVTIDFGETQLFEKKQPGKTVAFSDEVSEVLANQVTCEEKKTENAEAVALVMKEEILTADVYMEQVGFSAIYGIERPEPFYRFEGTVELERALELIREIENDVIDTKLSDAIMILPRLESELRKHFKHKVKSIRNSEDKSLDTFFSAFDIWPVEVENVVNEENSEERLYNLMTLLGDLEKAVKASECLPKVKNCDYDSSKIYGLLHALTESIRELEDCSNVTTLSHTLDMASQVDTAIREYDSIMKRTPTEYIAPRKKKKRLKSQFSEEISQKKYLKNVRKKVFEMVEEEAVDTEARLEQDSEKLERLERENDEAMKFVEAFLQKSQRRASELATIKTELKELSTVLVEMCERLGKAKIPEKEFNSELIISSQDLTPNEEAEPVKETVSGLLLALNNLKSRAKQKNEACREILSSASFEKEIKDHSATTRSSRSSFTAKNVEDLQSWVKDFKKIGDQSLYLSWTRPEGPLAESLVGYEIFVNGKLNQKVRNPQRLQAVLYSIDLRNAAEVLLYGLLDNGFKIFLATVTYATSSVTD